MIGGSEPVKSLFSTAIFTYSHVKSDFELKITNNEGVFRELSHFSRMFFLFSHKKRGFFPGKITFFEDGRVADDENRRCAVGTSPGVASLLGELAGASSTDFLTAGRERRS